MKVCLYSFLNVFICILVHTSPFMHILIYKYVFLFAVQPALDFIERRYKLIMQEHVPGKPVYVHVIAARLRMDMKIAFGEVCLR
jgi:hypothetical protein